MLPSVAFVGGVNNVINTNPQMDLQCSSCKVMLKKGSKFCNNCGANVEDALCPNCNEAYEAGSKFCNKCGHLLAPKSCECGTVLDKNASFCKNCGKKVDSE